MYMLKKMVVNERLAPWYNSLFRSLKQTLQHLKRSWRYTWSVKSSSNAKWYFGATFKTMPEHILHVTTSWLSRKSPLWVHYEAEIWQRRPQTDSNNQVSQFHHVCWFEIIFFFLFFYWTFSVNINFFCHGVPALPCPPGLAALILVLLHPSRNPADFLQWHMHISH